MISKKRFLTFFTGIFFVLAFLASQYFNNQGSLSQEITGLERAYKGQSSGVFVQGKGRVVKLLPDDLKGSRHQKFIVRIEEDFTILVAHNIDLAPRIDDLCTGDTIGFRGEYKWNDKGGILHWTHHDPAGKKEGGWIQHHSKQYK